MGLHLSRPGCPGPLTPVIVVKDGGSIWTSRLADMIIVRLRARMGPCSWLEVAAFDAEPALVNGFASDRTTRGLVAVAPHTPLRDVVETGIQKLIPYARPHAMLVIAHSQSQRTSVSASYLVNLAQQWSVTIHTIHLDSPRRSRHVKSMVDRLAKLSDALGYTDPGYSATATAGMLAHISDATGGKKCAARDELAQMRCADTIADDLSVH